MKEEVKDEVADLLGRVFNILRENNHAASTTFRWQDAELDHPGRRPTIPLPAAANLPVAQNALSGIRTHDLFFQDQALTTTPKTIASSEGATLFPYTCVAASTTFRWQDAQLGHPGRRPTFMKAQRRLSLLISWIFARRCIGSQSMS